MVFKYFPVAESLSWIFPVQEIQEMIFKLWVSAPSHKRYIWETEMIEFLSFSMLWELFLIARNVCAWDA